MEYSKAKAAVRQTLRGVSEDALARLFWRAEEVSFKQGEEIYREGAEVDRSMAILVEGQLTILQGGEQIGLMAEPVCFGEVAFFGTRQKRTATVRVSSSAATILRLEIDPEELKSGPFSEIGRILKARAWETVVQDSKRTG